MGVNINYGPRRQWYPSGPWIDGDRPKYSVPSSSANQTAGNPDPTNYKIETAKEIGKYLILKIKYPNCTNFEGSKILVFRDVTLIDLVNQKIIDPHFSNNKQYAWPIARFVPTNEGWKMAETFVSAMNE